jgi:hypothetical protein
MTWHGKIHGENKKEMKSMGDGSGLKCIERIEESSQS